MSNKPKSNAREIRPDNVAQMVGTGVFGTHYSNDALVHAARWNEPEKAKKIIEMLGGDWVFDICEETPNKAHFVSSMANGSMFTIIPESVLIVCNGIPFTMPEQVFDILFAPIQQ